MKLKLLTNDYIDLFCNGFIVSSYSKVITLPKEKDLLTFVVGLIDAAIITFRMILKATKNRENV